MSNIICEQRRLRLSAQSDQNIPCSHTKYTVVEEIIQRTAKPLIRLRGFAFAVAIILINDENSDPEFNKKLNCEYLDQEFTESEICSAFLLSK